MTESPTPAPTPDPTLEAALENARPSTPTGAGPAKATLVLGGAVLAAAGFLGGYLVNGGDDGAANAANGGPRMSGAGPQMNGGPAGATPGDITFGTVVSVNGTTVTVKTQDGKTVKVETSPDTEIQVTKDGTVDDLAKGDSVVVNGATEDGKVTADSITEGSMRLGRGDQGPQTSTE
jgi:hypothetical protein